MGWVRPASFAAFRGELTYSHNLDNTLIACASYPCPPGAPTHIPAIGMSAMLGNLGAASTRFYVLGGADVLLTSGGPPSTSGVVGIPKLGVGALSSGSLFVEVSGRWRHDWGGWPLRHWVLLAGWYR